MDDKTNVSIPTQEETQTPATAENPVVAVEPEAPVSTTVKTPEPVASASQTEEAVQPDPNKCPDCVDGLRGDPENPASVVCTTCGGTGKVEV